MVTCENIKGEKGIFNLTKALKRAEELAQENSEIFYIFSPLNNGDIIIQNSSTLNVCDVPKITNTVLEDGSWCEGFLTRNSRGI